MGVVRGAVAEAVRAAGDGRMARRIRLRQAGGQRRDYGIGIGVDEEPDRMAFLPLQAHDAVQVGKIEIIRQPLHQVADIDEESPAHRCCLDPLAITIHHLQPARAFMGADGQIAMIHLRAREGGVAVDMAVLRWRMQEAQDADGILHHRFEKGLGQIEAQRDAPQHLP